MIQLFERKQEITHTKRTKKVSAENFNRHVMGTTITGATFAGKRVVEKERVMVLTGPLC
jgi:hypothetical protein